MDCPLGNKGYTACFTCKHSECVGECEYPVDVSKQMKDGTRFKQSRPVWMAGLNRNSDQVELRDRRWYDKDGKEIFLGPLACGGGIEGAKKNITKHN